MSGASEALARREMARKELERYGYLNAKIESMVELSERYDSQLCNMTQQYSETRLGGGMKRDLGECIASLDDMHGKLKETIAEAQATMEHVSGILDNVAERNAAAAKVLACRYIITGAPMPYQDIAKLCSYSEPWTKELCLKALDLAAEAMEQREG